MPRNLSLAQKRQYLALIIERDNGFECFYCGKELDQKTAVFDHLNDNRRDNRLDNLVLACQSCNVKKASNEELHSMAWSKIELTEMGIFVGEKFLRKKLKISSSTESTEASKEIDINVKNSDITLQYITEKVEEDGFIDFKDALNSCVYLCRTKSGHGSQQSVRNYILTLTSPVGPFEITRNAQNKKVIVKRVNRTDLTQNQVQNST